MRCGRDWTGRLPRQLGREGGLAEELQASMSQQPADVLPRRQPPRSPHWRSRFGLTSAKGGRARIPAHIGKIPPIEPLGAPNQSARAFWQMLKTGNDFAQASTTPGASIAVSTNLLQQSSPIDPARVAGGLGYARPRAPPALGGTTSCPPAHTKRKATAYRS